MKDLISFLSSLLSPKTKIEETIKINADPAIANNSKYTFSNCILDNNNINTIGNMIIFKVSKTQLWNHFKSEKFGIFSFIKSNLVKNATM